MNKSSAARAVGVICAICVLALATSSCGADDRDADTAPVRVSTTMHNDAVAAFASDLLQHHAQALSMVDLTRGRTLDPPVAKLAEQIREGEAPEIETMSDWLTDWDEEIPATMRDHANGGHGDGDVRDSMRGIDTDMPGMQSADEMQALQDAPDPEFQTRWLEMMIRHHEGAVEMARAEIKQGRYKPAVDLGISIVASQTTEVATMKGLTS